MQKQKCRFIFTGGFRIMKTHISDGGILFPEAAFLQLRMRGIPVQGNAQNKQRHQPDNDAEDKQKYFRHIFIILQKMEIYKKPG